MPDRTKITLERREEFLHPLQAALQLAMRGRIGDADMLAGSETFARHGDHMRLVQQAMGNVGSRFQSSAAKECRNIRIGVERALRFAAANSRNRAQSANDFIAQLDVIRLHLADAMLW